MKARVEGAPSRRAKKIAVANLAAPVPGDNGAALARIVTFYKASQSDWDALALCPLENGLNHMIAKLSDGS